MGLKTFGLVRFLIPYVRIGRHGPRYVEHFCRTPRKPQAEPLEEGQQRLGLNRFAQVMAVGIGGWILGQVQRNQNAFLRSRVSALPYLRTILNHQQQEPPDGRLLLLVVPQGLEPWTR